MTCFLLPCKLIQRGGNVKKLELYDQSIKSVEKYKECSEELTDFDDFINETEKEYKKTLNN